MNRISFWIYWFYHSLRLYKHLRVICDEDDKVIDLRIVPREYRYGY